ncbi:MAG: extracellular solute-binding protein, partial [Chloroflexi bacterium]|nr:extracellular solute-binding protein [Chloroflexota bacterium]
MEDKLLRTVLDKFTAKYPNIKVSFEVIASEYAAVMLTRLGSGDAPDLFYVQQGYSQDWIKQGVLAPLDDLAAERGFDASAFYPGFLAPFQADGKTFGYPKDSSILAMQTNDAMLEKASVTPPTPVDELVAAAKKLKEGGVTTPMCFTNEYARAGAFIESFGGGMLNDDVSASAIDSPESKAAIEWYLTQVKDGLALRPKTDIGVDWCGQAFGEQKVAIAFEGNWIGPYMETTFADVKYTVSAIPMKAEKGTLSFTAAYGISPDAKNKDASWVLLSYLTGKEGMQEWVNGGLVLPARSDVDPTSERQKSYAAFAEFA